MHEMKIHAQTAKKKKKNSNQRAKNGEYNGR